MSYLLLTLVVVLLDQLSKWWIVSSMRLFESREVIPGFFNIVYVTNTGAAFSMLADVDSPWRHYFFLIVGIAAIIGLTVASYSMRKESSWYPIAFGLIAGGAIGNLIDRIRVGAVVDFLDVYIGNYHWPAFNIADSAICVGAITFLWISIIDSKNQKMRKVE